MQLESPRYNFHMRILNRRHVLLGLPAFPSLLKAAALSRIKLGVTTDEIDEDLITSLRFLREFGLSWAEVRNVWGKYNTDHTEDKIRQARGLLDEHQIKLSVLGTGFFKVPLPPDTPEGRRALDQQWALLDVAFRNAKILGSDKIRVFAFTFRGVPDKSHYPRIYELVGEAARRAKAANMRLALENVGSSYVWSGVEAAALLKAVRHDHLGLVWDPNNAASTGEKPFPDGFRLLDPARIFHVHLRDFKKGSDGKYEWAAVGTGEMDNLGQIRALLHAGYEGTFTLETHWASPQGKAHATRTSLTELLKIIERV